MEFDQHNSTRPQPHRTSQELSPTLCVVPAGPVCSGQACRILDSDPLPVDCHDWAGHCVLCHRREVHEICVEVRLPALADVGWLRLGAPALSGGWLYGRHLSTPLCSLLSVHQAQNFHQGVAAALPAACRELTNLCSPCLPCSHTCHAHSDGSCTSFGLSAWIVVFAAIQICLAQVGPLTHSPRQTKHH